LTLKLAEMLVVKSRLSVLYRANLLMTCNRLNWPRRDVKGAWCVHCI